MTTTREDFETAWMSRNGMTKPPARFPNGGDYVYPAANTAWWAWQAACAQSQQDALDAARLDALEEIARKSSTGVSIDYVYFVEEGYVVENGYRVMRRGVLYERKKTIRSAIDAAIAAQGASNV